MLLMPIYQLRFRIETCLAHNADMAIEFSGHRPTFLFSEKAPSDGQVIARIEVDAVNNREAWDKASGTVLPPILDALSFSTGTPLLLRDCELVLKAQPGDKQRRALYVGHRHEPSLVALGAVEINETKKILAGGEDLRLPLCWHRYALDRQLAHEQFVFNWLAFEALAGDATIPSRCPTCNEELQHCGNPVVHAGSNKAAARQIFQAAHPGTDNREFNNEIWNKSRNRVFHGRRYPEPRYLTEISKHSNRLHAAVDRRLDDALGLGHRLRRHQGYETWYRQFIYVEWTTQSSAEVFAQDWPAAHFIRMAEDEQADGPGHQEAIANGITLLGHREFENW
jgi:hypothetical protein